MIEANLVTTKFVNLFHLNGGKKAVTHHRLKIKDTNIIKVETPQIFLTFTVFDIDFKTHPKKDKGNKKQGK